jgi:hypothetical protein
MYFTGIPCSSPLFSQLFSVSQPRLRWGNVDAQQYSAIDSFKTFDFSALPLPPPDLPRPISRQVDCRQNNLRHLQPDEREEDTRRLQKLEELHWLYQQVIAAVPHFVNIANT